MNNLVSAITRWESVSSKPHVIKLNWSLFWMLGRNPMLDTTSSKHSRRLVITHFVTRYWVVHPILPVYWVIYVLAFFFFSFFLFSSSHLVNNTTVSCSQMFLLIKLASRITIIKFSASHVRGGRRLQPLTRKSPKAKPNQIIDYRWITADWLSDTDLANKWSL